MQNFRPLGQVELTKASHYFFLKGGGKVVTYISLVYLRYVLSRAERYFFGYVILVASRKILLDGNRVSRCRDIDHYV